MAVVERPLRIYLTGRIAVERGDVLVPERRLPGRQGRFAFALLAAERDHPMSMDRIADVLWNGEPPAAWTTALRVLMSKIRGTLAEPGLDAGTIDHASGCYQLRLPPGAWIDLEAAAAAVHDAEAHLRDGEVTAAFGSALVATAIAKRPFLEGEGGPWVERRRAMLRDVQMRALSCRAEAALAIGDPTGAAGDAGRIIDLEPFREHAYVLLMRAQVAAGNDAEALATYDRLRTTLSTELGTDPSVATQAAYREILGAR